MVKFWLVETVYYYIFPSGVHDADRSAKSTMFLCPKVGSIQIDFII